MSRQTSSNTKHYWVVVADESNAIVYGRESRSGPLHELFSLNNEIARKKTAELISDSGGRSFDSRGKGRHTMSNEKTDPKKHAATVFAKTIAEQVAKVIHDKTCRGYALVAAPRFLGLLRDALSTATTTEPYATVDKAIVGQEPTTIEKLLADL